MTAFDKNFLFLDRPDGTVEDLAAMKAAGFSGVFCNIRNYPPSQWDLIRSRAKAQGMFCGPWARTVDLDENGNQISPAVFSEQIVDLIVAIADNWGSPGIINSEVELNGHQEHLNYIVAKIGSRDIALSMQSNPFDSIDWSVLGSIPVLVQIFPVEAPGYEPIATRNKWWTRGAKCVYMTYGTYGGMKPGDFNLQTPYSLFTGNAMGASFDPWKPTSSGWQACKEEVKLIPLTERQVPYTGPYYGPTKPNGGKKSPTAEALKRAMSHLGYMPWTDFDSFYNAKLVDAMKKWQAHVGLQASGDYGKGSWQEIRKATFVKDGATLYALDRYARKLIQDEAGATAESDAEEKVQKFITEFWTIAIAHNGAWHYDQGRPFDVSVDPAAGGDSDCSGMVVQAHHYAQIKSGFSVPDPAKYNYAGFGNTDDHEDDWVKIGPPYRVGDLAHFFNERHVIECIKPGTIDTAQWASNGREAAPELISSLRSYSRYPNEFLYVVRPDLLAD